MKKYIYVISAVFGRHEMSGVRTYFATIDESIAKKYCEKANSILQKYEDYYDNIINIEVQKVGDDELRDDYCHFSKRSDFTSGHFHYTKIELK